MKITTRAVYDMTDPRFWGDDFEDACIEAESFEYDGPVALCGRDSDATGGTADGQGSQNEGSSGGNSNNGGGYSMHDQAMSGLSSAEASSLGYSGTSSAANLSGGYQDSTGKFGSFGSDGNRTAYASGSPTSYGVQNYSREHNVPWSRANEALQDQHINTQYAQRRAAVLAAMAPLETDLHESIEKAGYSPSAALGLHESVINGQLSNLNAAGVLSEPQANAFSEAYGGIGYQVGRGIERGLGIDLNMATPEDVQTPSETYSDAFTGGLINVDGSLTAKGLFKAYGPILGYAAGPLAGAVFGATASVPAAIGTGFAVQTAGNIAASPMSDDTAMATGAMSEIGIPGVAELSWAGNLMDLGAAVNSANPGVTSTASATSSVSSGDSTITAADLFSDTTTASADTSSVNHYADYKSSSDSDSSSSSGYDFGLDYGGVNMYA